MATYADRAFNVVTTMACVAIVLVGVERFAPSTRSDSPALGRQNERPRLKRPAYVPGERLAGLGQVDFSKTEKTVVIFVTSYCPYCIDSMDFYRALTIENGRSRGMFQLIIVGPEPMDTLTTFVRRQRLEVDGVVSVARGQLKVWGTPTLIVTDRKGAVERVWVGEQGQAGQAAIVAMLRNTRL